ncbi:Hypothetical predicted protein [Olea europaea subsp. europaea]|uniref:Uncharacterized protein n=1 Tax=Olea europaea subsp. europaea TaxID=158383 RepID=A0A8S0V8W7_OLEEU|nr:Hypothetical predicted protein [Olea europaea subsp. europaea]
MFGFRKSLANPSNPLDSDAKSDNKPIVTPGRRTFSGPVLITLNQKSNPSMMTTTTILEEEHLPYPRTPLETNMDMAKAKQGDALLDLSYILGELKGMATDMGSELDSVDLKSMPAENLGNVIPSTLCSSNYIALRFCDPLLQAIRGV